MEYPQILNLIDDYLDRLTEARALLLDRDDPPISAEKRAAKPTAARNAPRRSAVREKQAALALEMPVATDVTAASKTRATTERQSNRRMKKAQDSAPSLPFVQDELFLPQPQSTQPQEEIVEEVVEVREQEALHEVVVPTVVKVRAQQRPSGRSKRRTVAARALGGQVSAAPVFIPAAKIRQELAQKVPQSGTDGEKAGSPAEVPLTAEMLTQRWVQGLTS
jgi:hypothetical protein